MQITVNGSDQFKGAHQFYYGGELPAFFQFAVVASATAATTNGQSALENDHSAAIGQAHRPAKACGSANGEEAKIFSEFFIFLCGGFFSSDGSHQG